MALTNIQKAAIFLKSIDPEVSMTVFSMLDKKTSNAISEEMAKLSTIAEEDKQSVMSEYSQLSGGLPGAPVAGAPAPAGMPVFAPAGAGGAPRPAMPVFTKAAPKDALPEKFPPDIVQKIGVERLAAMVSHEHPAVVAVILSYFDSQSAANILLTLPRETHTEIVRVMAADAIDTDVKDEVRKMFSQKINALTNASKGKKGKGKEMTAEILSFIDVKKSGEIISELKKQDEKMGIGIEGLMFNFENIFLKINDDRAIQKALRNIDRKDLALAMRKVNEETKEIIYRNMSKAAAEMLTEDMATMGPQKMVSVKDAQRKIVNVLLALEKQGVIAFSGNKEEEELV